MRPLSHYEVPSTDKGAVQERLPGNREHHLLHHSYIWLSVLRAVPYIVFTILVSTASLFSSFVEQLETAKMGYLALPLGVGAFFVLLLIVVGIGLVSSAITYRYKWYEFDLSEFGFYSGIFNKKHSHVPYSKIQSVNEKASLLQRLVGVCTVTIDTAGGESNKALEIPYVERSAAERIRREVFMRKSLLASGVSPEEVDAKIGVILQSKRNGQAPIPPWQSMKSSKEAQASLKVRSLEAQTGAQVQTNDPAIAEDRIEGSLLAPDETAGPATTIQKSQDLSDSDMSLPQSSNVLDIPASLFDDMRGVFAHGEVDTGRTSFEIGLSNKELLFSALTGNVSFLVILIAVVSGGSAVIAGLADAQILMSSEELYFAAMDIFGDRLGVLAVIMVLGILLLLWLISMVATCLSYAGFRARRKGNRVEVERGLITHMFIGIDVERIQSIQIHQTLFQRLLGYCSLSFGRVGALAKENQGNDIASDNRKLVVHPFLPMDRVEEVLAGLAPEFCSLPLASRCVSRKAFRRALTRRMILKGPGFWMLVALLISWVLLSCFAPDAFHGEAFIGANPYRIMVLITVILGVLAVAIMVIDGISAALWYRYAAFGWNRFGLSIINGGFSLNRVVVPRTKIQVAQVKTNPLQRLAGVATISVTTAEGISSTTHRLIDVSRNDAQEWANWLQPRVSNNDFRQGSEQRFDDEL